MNNEIVKQEVKDVKRQKEKKGNSEKKVKNRSESKIKNEVKTEECGDEIIVAKFNKQEIMESSEQQPNQQIMDYAPQINSPIVQIEADDEKTYQDIKTPTKSENMSMLEFSQLI